MLFNNIATTSLALLPLVPSALTLLPLLAQALSTALGVVPLARHQNRRGFALAGVVGLAGSAVNCAAASVAEGLRLHADAV